MPASLSDSSRDGSDDGGNVVIVCIAYTMNIMLGVPTKRICTAQNLLERQ